MVTALLMEVQDNSKGLIIETMNTSLGHGLANMQTRARTVGGDVEISSAHNEESTVLARVSRISTS